MLNITEHKRFTTIHRNNDIPGEHYILKDNETGVLYYMINGNGSGAGVGLTPLLDADGKPIVDK